MGVSPRSRRESGKNCQPSKPCGGAARNGTLHKEIHYAKSTKDSWKDSHPHTRN